MYVAGASGHNAFITVPRSIAAYVLCSVRANQLPLLSNVLDNVRLSDLAVVYVRACRELFKNKADVAILGRKTCDRIIRLAAKSKLVPDGQLDGLLAALP